MSRSEWTRFGLRALAVLAGLALVVSIIAWFVEAAQARRVIAAWRAGSAPGGVALASAEPSVGGFPIMVSIRLDDVRVTDPARLPGITLAAPVLSARSFVWSPLAWSWRAGHGLAVTSGSGPSASGGTILAAASEASGEVTHQVSEIGLATLVSCATPHLDMPDGGAVAADGASLVLRIPHQAPQSHAEAALGLDVRIDAIRLRHAAPPLGGTLTGLSGSATLLGIVPRRPTVAALAAWRDDGGTIEFHDLTLNWGPLHADGDGTLALDQAMQPLASFSASIQGYAQALAALAAAGRIKPEDAGYLRTGFDLLADKSANGGKDLKVPITIQDGTLVVGPAKLLVLPRVSWP